MPSLGADMAAATMMTWMVKPGDVVKLSGRLFHGVEAEVLCLLPARQRVKVLLDFLGGPKEAEVGTDDVVPVGMRHLAAE